MSKTKKLTPEDLEVAFQELTIHEQVSLYNQLGAILAEKQKTAQSHLELLSKIGDKKY